MANEIRLRRNNIAGTITDNPLTNVATTINSPGFVDLPVVDATNHLLLILDPLEINGTAEIVRVTAHTVAATSVTVVRGSEGSVARTHILGTTWFHGPVASDYTLSDVTSGTRPTTPYRGELIFETDTNSYVGRDTSDVWQTAVPLGTWTAYTPTDSQITVGNGTRTAFYARVGRIIHIRWALVFGTTSALTGGGAQIGLPFTAVAGDISVGACHYIDTGTRNWVGTCRIGEVSQSLAGLYHTEATTAGSVTSTGPFVFGTADAIYASLVYEAAS